VRKVLTEEEPYPYRHFRYRKIGKEESGATTHKLVSSELRQACLWNWALVIALWSHEKAELAPSVVHAGELPKGPVDRLN
jgi:hypothetical protein